MSEPSDAGRSESPIVSPELALVDPDLRAWAQSRLADPTEQRAGEALRRLTAVRAPEPLARHASRRRARPAALVATALVLVGTLLLADVRVEVGKTPAQAGSQAVSPSADRKRRGPSQAIGPQPLGQPQRLAWAPAAGATGYHVALYRDGRRVFAADVERPEVTVPATWTSSGRSETLSGGELRWFVWPVTQGRRGATAIVQARLAAPSS